MTTSTHDIDVDAALADVLDHEYDPTPATTAPAERPAPFVAALRCSNLFADPTYQRDLDTHRVDKMAAAYDVALVGIIEVSGRPDGRHAILDGQHRWAVVRTHAFASTDEDPHLPCRVHSGLTVTEEAELYHQLNTTRRQLTGWDRWVARRGAGDPDVAAIEDCAARHDVIIGMHAGPNVLRATKACEHVVDLGGIGLLDEVLEVIRGAWPDDQSGMDAAIIHGLGHVLATYDRDQLDLARLVTTLAGIVPRQLTARAAAARELHTGTRDRLAAHVIVERYNTVKGGRLAPFFDVVRPLTRSQTAKGKRETEQRERILTWARESKYAGREYHRHVSAQMRDAYETAHGRGPTPAEVGATTQPVEGGETP